MIAQDIRSPAEKPGSGVKLSLVEQMLMCAGARALSQLLIASFAINGAVIGWITTHHLIETSAGFVGGFLIAYLYLNSFQKVYTRLWKRLLSSVV